jgi:general secretion pathway protein A
LYQGFYHLKENPFRLTPDPAFMCMTLQHQEALSGLVYTACTRPGLTVLVGEAGTGKTTLLYALMGLLEKRRFVTAICTNPTLTRSEFYDLLMLKFGVECDSTLKSRQVVALEEKIRRDHAEGRPALLVIDEAQRLSVELLEEVRLLLNLETTREKLVEIILAGQPELLETLSRYEMRQLKQRVSCICRLKPLDRGELREYLFHRLAQAGLPNQTLFSETCIDLIHNYTRGIPRLANTLCDSCLQVGVGLRSSKVTPSIIEEAARDLDLVPADSQGELPAKDPVAAQAAAQSSATISPAGAAAVLQNGTGTMGEKSGERSPTQDGNAAAGVAEARPLQTYADRQKSVGFFASFLERWK